MCFLRGLRLVVRMPKKCPQHPQQILTGSPIVFQQRSQRPLDKSLQSWIVPQNVKQPRQLDIRQLVESLALPRSAGRVSHLTGLGVRAAELGQVGHRRTDSDPGVLATVPVAAFLQVTADPVQRP